jgi:hypothetical protein
MSTLTKFLVELVSTLITLPGSGFLIWYAVLIFVGLIYAYASVVDPTTIFALAMIFLTKKPGATVGPETDPITHHVPLLGECCLQKVP